MKIQEVKSQLVYFKEFETSLQEIEKYVGKTPMQMAEEVTTAGGVIAGPQVWLYEGADGKPETKFKLTIAIPITDSVDSLSNSTKKLPDAKCFTTNHEGAWNQLGQTYEKIFMELTKSGHAPGHICREVYHTVDFENPTNNITEVQVELN